MLGSAWSGRRLLTLLGLSLGVFLCVVHAARADSTYWVDVCANGYSASGFKGGTAANADEFHAVSCGPGSSNTISVTAASGGFSGGSYSKTAAAATQDDWGVLLPAGETFVGTSFSNSTYINPSQGNGDGPGVPWQQGWWTLSMAGVWSAGIPGVPDCFAGSPTVCDTATGPVTSSWSTGVASVTWGLACELFSSNSAPCNEDGATATLSNWRVQLDDPDTTPAITANNSGSSLAGDVGHWIDGAARNGDSLNWSYADDGGVCSASVYLSAQWSQDLEPAGTSQDDHTQTIGALDAADNSLNQTTCSGLSSMTEQPDLATLNTDAYELDSSAQNPGNLQSGSDGTAADGIIYVDNNTPAVSFSASSDRWYSQPQSVTVSASDGSESAGRNSGIASTTCSDADNQTWSNGKPDARGGYAGTQSEDVTISASGTSQLFCTAANGVGTTSPTQNLTVQIDPQTPTLTMSKPALAPTYLKRVPTITASGREKQRLSGVTSSCSGHNAMTKDTISTPKPAAEVKLKLTSGGKWTVTCHATTGAGLSASDSERIDLATQPMDAPLKFAWRWSGATTTLKSLSFKALPSHTRWAVKLQPKAGKTAVKIATTPAGVKVLVKWLEKQRYVDGDRLTLELTRPGYRDEGAVFTVHLHRLPTVAD